MFCTLQIKINIEWCFLVFEWNVYNLDFVFVCFPFLLGHISRIF